MSGAAEPRPLRLSLQAGDVLPGDISWLILEGYIRTSTWDEDGESIVLGLWGPGEWVTTAYSAFRPVDMQCVSAVKVEQIHPGEEEVAAFLQLQIRNLERIFGINRIRSAEQRLLALLRWISVRFGQVNSHGHRLSLKDMNLTHKALADICGLTRVTVTKTLNRFRALGVLQEVGEVDLLIPDRAGSERR